ncbi:hypothetical protein, partial [Chryseobacterium sp. SIMBA_038]|uniref:ParM/StbA family protein n=1 Tax=Chryseobacterium sp. SIMBA_038 TaxID=3085780 RepID=UPI00397BBE15
DSGGTVVAHAFPSLSPLAPPRKISRWDAGAFTARKTAEITVNGIDYEVGPDISITAAHGWTGSALADDYALTGNYAALLFGALYFSGVTQVDHLVLGLPVHLMGEFSGALKKQFLGKFEFGIGSVSI